MPTRQLMGFWLILRSGPPRSAAAQAQALETATTLLAVGEDGVRALAAVRPRWLAATTSQTSVLVHMGDDYAWKIDRAQAHIVVERLAPGVALPAG